MRGLDGIKATGAILGGIPPVVEGVADKGAIGGAFCRLEFSQGNDLIDDARQFQAGLRASSARRVPTEWIEPGKRTQTSRAISRGLA
jgi:hypothetical protein